jgi:hypothetical protein
MEHNFHVDSELTLGVPNDGSGPLLNSVGGTVVMLQRGGVSLSVSMFTFWVAKDRGEGNQTAYVFVGTVH